MPDLFDMFDEPWAPLLPFTAGRPFRVEDYVQEGNYVFRAELPGLDPEKDVEVSVEGGTLTIHAERHEEHKEPIAANFAMARSPARSPCPRGGYRAHRR